MAADVKFETITAALSTVTGNQDFTITSFGTPVAAMLFLSGSTVDNTVTDDGFMCVGFTDGTRQVSFGYSSNDNVATTSETRFNSNTEMLSCTDPGGATIGVSGSASLIVDGLRINITNAPTNALLITVVLIGGADVAAVHANFQLLSSTVVDVTAPGFQPSLVFTGTTGNGGTGAAAHAIFSFGVAHDTGAGIDQKGICHSAQSVVGTSNCSTFLDSDGVGGQVYDGALSWSAKLGTFDASGFTVTSSATPGDYLYYLALSFTNSPDISVFTTTSPTATGSKTFTEPGFTPSFAMIIGTDVATVDTVSTTESASSSFFIGDATNQITVGSSIEDGVTTTNSGNISYAGGLKSLIDGTVIDHAATFTSFGATGPTFNFTTASSAKQWIGLAIGPGGAGPTIYDVSFSLGQSNSVAPTGQATAQAGVSLSQAVGVADSSAATAQAATSLAAQYGLSMVGQAAFDVAVSISSNMGMTASGSATATALLPVDLGLGATVSALAQAIASVAFAQGNGLVVATTGLVFDVSLSLASTLGVTSLAQVTLNGSVTLNQAMSAELAANANTYGAFDLGLQVAVQIAATALANAGITISAITSISTVGTTIIVGIVTPDDRSYTIEIDNREFLILAENRTYEVK